MTTKDGDLEKFVKIPCVVCLFVYLLFELIYVYLTWSIYKILSPKLNNYCATKTDRKNDGFLTIFFSSRFPTEIFWDFFSSPGGLETTLYFLFAYFFTNTLNNKICNTIFLILQHIISTTFVIHQDRRASRNSPVEEITIVTVLGLDRVGKSSLLRRCFYNKFEKGYTPTVEELHRGQLIYNGNKFNINVHEMGGFDIFYFFLTAWDIDHYSFKRTPVDDNVIMSIIHRGVLQSYYGPNLRKMFWNQFFDQ